MVARKPKAQMRSINVELPLDDMMRLVNQSKAGGYPDARDYASHLLLSALAANK